ncbi:MAG: hypothetical protein ACR2QC_03005 [Gammaproteobacteria bacterium]
MRTPPHSALTALVADGKLLAKTASAAAKKYKINPNAPNPLGV